MIETKYKDIYIDGVDIFKQIGNKLIKLCQWIDNVGYYQVCFRINKKKKYIRVHRLIAETLLPNPNKLNIINHIDGNKLNNKLENLEWCNNSHNTQEAYNNNLYKSKFRCSVSCKNKTTGEVLVFKSIRECSSFLKLNRKTITAILKNNKKNNYNYEFEYIEPVSTIPGECKGVGLEISTNPKRKAA